MGAAVGGAFIAKNKRPLLSNRSVRTSASAGSIYWRRDDKTLAQLVQSLSVSSFSIGRFIIVLQVTKMCSGIDLWMLQWMIDSFLSNTVSLEEVNLGTSV